MLFVRYGNRYHTVILWFNATFLFSENNFTCNILVQNSVEDVKVEPKS